MPVAVQSVYVPVLTLKSAVLRSRPRQAVHALVGLSDLNRLCMPLAGLALLSHLLVNHLGTLCSFERTAVLLSVAVKGLCALVKAVSRLCWAAHLPSLLPARKSGL